MQTSTIASWKEGMAFELDLQGHRLTIDSAEDSGGKDRGPRPKGLLLAALAGCTGMDVVSLLKKMRMEFDSFAVQVEADSGEDHPRVYREIRIRYLLTGGRLERDKIEQAVRLSQEKYCGVSAMLRKSVPLTWEIVENPPS